MRKEKAINQFNKNFYALDPSIFLPQHYKGEESFIALGNFHWRYA